HRAVLSVGAGDPHTEEADVREAGQRRVRSSTGGEADHLSGLAAAFRAALVNRSGYLLGHITQDQPVAPAVVVNRELDSVPAIDPTRAGVSVHFLASEEDARAGLSRAKGPELEFIIIHESAGLNHSDLLGDAAAVAAQADPLRGGDAPRLVVLRVTDTGAPDDEVGSYVPEVLPSVSERRVAGPFLGRH